MHLGIKTTSIVAILTLGLLACAKASGPPATAEPPPPVATGALPPAPLVQPAPVDPLPSWNDGPTKSALTSFVARVTTEGSPDFVPGAQRIATFDNDGTLWSEQPIYVQLAFALDRVTELAPQHPEWKTKEPFKSVLAGDLKKALSGGNKALGELVMATHAGMTSQEFSLIVERWLSTSKHPKYARPYTECVYQPMLEVLAYLRANGFKTFIVSGGGVEFMRAFAERVYGVPPEQVIGSSVELKYELRGDTPVLVRLPKVGVVDDGPVKPASIQAHIGRRPIAAFGNSDGDQQMLEWTAAGPGPRFLLLVHHTDGVRETAYDHPSAIGQLDQALSEAKAKGWAVASMKDDWKTIFLAP